MPLSAGTRLGPYEIVAPLGAGGMGEVYRARDARLKREVALKVLPEGFSQDPDRLARFQREAELLATLNHPNIAAVYGLEKADPSTTSTGSGQAGSGQAVQAIVLELVEGETLADVIGRGPLALTDALPIARQIAEALEAAHEKGVIHRDLKPANIKVTPDGKVKVLDFGLAKMLESETTASSLSMSPTLSLHATYAGVILGTAAYMSPEQARGKPVDRRTDIWAFGCVLFEMLAGRQTFDVGDTVSDAVAAILKTDPDWSALPADTPAHIRTLLRRCLQKDPQKRLPHIGIARIEIDEGPAEPAAAPREVPALAPPVVPPRPLWRRAMPQLAAAIVASVLTGIALWSFRPSTSPLTVTRFPFTLGEGQQFTNNARQMVAMSPNGTQIVYVTNQGLYLRSMSETEARPIPGAEVTEGGGANPVFSPDGRSIAFRSGVDQTLKKIAVSGGTAVTICPADGLYGMSWDTDAIVFGQASKGIMRVSANGGKPELLVGVKGDEVAHGPQMLPGGQAVLFTLATGTGTDRWDTAHVVVQTLKSGERKTLIEGGSDARYVSTGHIVYALGGTLFAVPFDLRRLEVTGGAVPIVEGVRRSGATGSAQFSFSNTGSLIYIPGPVSTSSAQSSLVLADRKGGVDPLKLPPRAYEHPRVSPDGKRIVFATDDGKDANVWTYDLSGASAPRRLTFGGKNRFPIWSADLERVAFQSDRDGDLGIFSQRADGTDQAVRLTKPDQGTSHALESWSPDGKRFLFRIVKNSSVSLWTFSIADKKAAPFGDVRSIFPTNAVFSPDGRWVAYTAYETPGNGGIFVQPFPATGAKYQISSGTGFQPLWSPDGKELFYRLPGTTFLAVSVTTQPAFAVGNPVALPLPRGGLQMIGPASPRTYDIFPDGKILGVVPSGQTPSGAVAAPEIQVVLNWFEELKARVPVTK